MTQTVVDTNKSEFHLSIHFDTSAATLEDAVAAFREWLADSDTAQSCVRVWHDDGSITYVDGDGTSWTG